MTDKEKAKAYDEALERAKKLYAEAKANDYASDMEDYEFIFPELAESEDERIRKDIRLVVESSATKYFKETGQMPEWYDRIVSWLEKQKEQKPAEWSEDTIRKAIEEVGLTQHQINWFKNNVFPPKQEWSEEDVDMLNSCISSIEEAKENRYAYKETDGDTSYDHEIAWLKSLHLSWKPSEEQMEALRETIDFAPDTFKPKCTLVTLQNDLKKLI